MADLIHHLLSPIKAWTSYHKHWEQTDVDYAAATCWYARPGATSNVPPAPDQALVCGIWPPKPHRIEGALEGHRLPPTC